MSDKSEMQTKILARLSDYTRTFSSPHGMKVLKDMRASYCKNSPFHADAITMARNVGKMEVVLDIEFMLRQSKSKKLLEMFFPQTEPPEEE